MGDPWTDYESIYNRDYYAGKGADPLIDYVSEINDVRTARHYEWTGILQWATSVVPISASTHWLDFGAGSGGLVRHLRRQGIENAFAFEPSKGAPRAQPGQGWWLEEVQLAELNGTFDVVSAIEVLEHFVDPVGELRRIRDLLRPGGLLVATTTNAAPYRDRIASWRYVIPEIHVSFFEPLTLQFAMEKAGLVTSSPGYVPGWTNIIRYKVLKNIHLNRMGGIERLLPWSVVCRLIDARLHLSAQPVGWRPNR